MFKYIEIFYNTARIHSHCDYSSPSQYEDKYLRTMAKSAVKRAG